MSPDGPPRRLRQWWPRGIRARLTLIYTSLFLVGGVVLLAITFLLVSHSLDAGSGDVGAKVAPSQALLKQCKEETASQPAGKKVRPAAVKTRCEKVFLAGAQAGTRAQRAHTEHELEAWSLAGLGLLTVASAVLGWVMAGRVLRPVSEITGAARRASERHLGERINLSGPDDELKELADTFDAMLDRLDLASPAQRQFVANVSHELRTPLTSMRTAIDVVLAKPNRTPEQLEATAEKVRRAIDRAECIIDALLTLAVSNRGPDKQETVDLATAAEDAVDSVREQARRAGLRLEVDLEDVMVSGNRILLERLVANLVDNTVAHNSSGGWVRVRTSETGGQASLEVANSGPVVPSDLVPQLFEPFRRGEVRTGASGVGLGLSIVQSVAGAHGAVVEATPGPEGGLTVTVTLPGWPGPAPPSPVPPAAPVGAAGGQVGGRAPA